MDEDKSLEERQLRNIRNRIKELINQKAPEALIRLAIFLRISVPKDLVDKYIYKKE